MKIAMLTSFFYPHKGGTEKYVLDLALALTKKGNKVTVFTHTKGMDKKYGEINVLRIPSIWIPYQPLIAVKLKKKLLDFDIIHFHVPPYFFHSTTVIPVSAKHVVTYHCDIFIPKKIKGITISFILRKIIDSYFQKKAVIFLKKSSAVIVTSKDYAETSSTLTSIRYTPVPIGINMDEYRYKDSIRESDLFDFLFIGRLAPSKGIDILLKASSLLIQQGYNFNVRIIGSGEDEIHLKKLSNSLNLESYVQFTGRLPQKEMVKALSSTKALILPSISRLEAFGIVQLEAFSCMVPVIASDLPGVRGLIRNSGGGWIVPPGDSVKLAEAMNKVISSPKEAKQRGEKGFNYIRENNQWDKISQKVINLYKSILSD